MIELTKAPGPPHRAPDGDASPIPRVRHGTRLIALAAAVALIGAAAFCAGFFLHRPEEAALKNADATIDVWANAEERVVYDGFSLPGVVGAGSQVGITVTEASPYGITPLVTGSEVGTSGIAAPSRDQNTTGGTPAAHVRRIDRVVVSAMGVTAGTSLAYGQLLAEVSGRPIFAWPSSSPLYRDLTEGDTGRDVRDAQRVLHELGYLRSDPDGVFGAQTMQALRDLYDSAGYQPPIIAGSSPGLSWREFTAIPAPPAMVVSTAPQGAVLTSGMALLTVRSQTPTLTSTASVREVSELQAGADVGVTVAGKAPVKTKVATIGEFTTDEKTNVSGYPLTIEYPAELGALSPGTSVVLRRWSEAAPSLAVPSTAIRQDANGAYVLTRGTAEGGNEGRYIRIAVKATAQSEGWVALAPGSLLAPTADVLVSGGAFDG